MGKIKFAVSALAISIVAVAALSSVPFRSTGQDDKFRKAKDPIPDRTLLC